MQTVTENNVVPLDNKFMLKIKLTRTGKKHQPHYRIIVAEARSKRDGKAVDSIGHYHPLNSKKTLVIDIKKYQYWLGVGAQPTQTVKNLIRKET